MPGVVIGFPGVTWDTGMVRHQKKKELLFIFPLDVWVSGGNPIGRSSVRRKQLRHIVKESHGHGKALPGSLEAADGCTERPERSAEFTTESSRIPRPRELQHYRFKALGIHGTGLTIRGLSCSQRARFRAKRRMGHPGAG
jgi:hypothetical protein